MRLALYDIDGVLANDEHRVHHALAKNWGAYFAPHTVAKDEVFEEGWKHVQDSLAEGRTIGYFTGRGMSLKDTTEAWLDRHEFPFGRVVTRGWWQGTAADKGREKLPQFKLRVYGEILSRPEVEDAVLYEDDPEVVRVITEKFGPGAAVLIGWHVKQQALISKGTA